MLTSLKQAPKNDVAGYSLSSLYNLKCNDCKNAIFLLTQKLVVHFDSRNLMYLYASHLYPAQGRENKLYFVHSSTRISCR